MIYIHFYKGTSLCNPVLSRSNPNTLPLQPPPVLCVCGLCTIISIIVLEKNLGPCIPILPSDLSTFFLSLLFRSTFYPLLLQGTLDDRDRPARLGTTEPPPSPPARLSSPPWGSSVRVYTAYVSWQMLFVCCVLLSPFFLFGGRGSELFLIVQTSSVCTSTTDTWPSSRT